jgi:hypothetical protein
VGVFLPHLPEDDMSEIEMNDDVETEEFTDELSDEALDRDGGGRVCLTAMCGRAGN